MADDKNKANEQVSLPSLTFAQLGSLVKELIREAKAPSPEEQERLDAERLRLQKRKSATIKRVERDEAMKRARYSNCRHLKQTVTGGLLPCIGGQHFSNGKVIIFCLRCQAPLKEIEMNVPVGTNVDIDFSKIDMTDVYNRLPTITPQRLEEAQALGNRAGR